MIYMFLVDIQPGLHRIHRLCTHTGEFLLLLYTLYNLYYHHHSQWRSREFRIEEDLSYNGPIGHNRNDPREENLSSVRLFNEPYIKAQIAIIMILTAPVEIILWCDVKAGFVGPTVVSMFYCKRKGRIQVKYSERNIELYNQLVVKMLNSILQEIFPK